MRFDYHLPVNLYFGRGRLADAGDIAARYGKKALIVTGTGSTKKSGVLDRLISYLSKAGITSAVYSEVTRNPLTTTVVKGVEILQEKECDMVIGLGGGSIMDCAKAISFLGENEGDINDYIFNKTVGNKALPLMLIPTTCGTGSEGNGFAVLTNPENGDKKSLKTNAIIAKASIIDSELMETMPERVLAAVGFDAFCHCMEAYLAKNSQPLTNIMSLSGMELVSKYLVEIYKGSEDSEGWDGITWASMIGGMVIHTAGVILPHGMEHPVSGLKNVVHGLGLAALTPVITEASLQKMAPGYEMVSKCLGGQHAHECTDRINRLLEELDMTVSLGELEIEPGDIPWLTENCYKVSSASIANHPVTFTQEEISQLYEKAI